MSAALRIAVVGAGGVGGVYGGELARAGHSVALLARGAHLDAIRNQGLEVRTPEGAFTVRPTAASDVAGIGAVDLAIVAVKTYSLDEVLPAVRALADGGADVLPLLNGVDAADRLVAGGVPRARVLGGLTSISAARTAPGVVERKSPFESVTLGEPSGGTSARAERIAEAFRSAGVDAKVSADIASDLWKKLAFISTMAAACGLARAPVGAVREAPYGRLLLERALAEAFAVGKARGLPVGPDDAANAMRFVDGLGPALKPSLLLDLEAGSRTEIADLSGAISRFGREVGVPTPIHDAATAALTAASR